MATRAKTIVWFRRDLRLADNHALTAAVELGVAIPVYIHAQDEEAPWQPDAASRTWLHHSLKALAGELGAGGAQLVIREGESLTVLRELLKETGATAVYWNRLYDPATRERDTKVKSALREQGFEAESFASHLLVEPHVIKNNQNSPMMIFTPYWKRLRAMYDPADPLPAPKLDSLDVEISSLRVDDLALLPRRVRWDKKFEPYWQQGEVAAQKRLRKFVKEIAGEYVDTRNIPAVDGTSILSPHLHFGELSPRQIWCAVRDAQHAAKSQDVRASCESYLRELAWRDYAHYLLFHFPETTDRPLKKEYGAFPWGGSKAQFDAWKRGQTGYPIVDAGMRQLWETGWMHNRVRMVVASFLIKHLLIDWREGARWFWDTLVDADLANNTMGWQWVAGCGADASPFFRIFNPVTQAEKFDPDGAYIRRWVPELAKLENKSIRAPWLADEKALRDAGVTLGIHYPAPIVDHATAREGALEAYQAVAAERKRTE
ncbi:deoxyribodipyrimidine photo-lyase [soil metagenome]